VAFYGTDLAAQTSEWPLRLSEVLKLGRLSPGRCWGLLRLMGVFYCGGRKEGKKSFNLTNFIPKSFRIIQRFT